MTVPFDRTESALQTMTLSIVVLYDDYHSGCRAQAFFNQLKTRLDEEVQPKLALWRMDVLQLPGAAGAALRDFGCADILVLALRPEGMLPGPVLDWVESWAKHRLDGESALVVMHVPPEDASPAPSLRRLQQLAQRRGLHLFCEWEA